METDGQVHHRIYLMIFAILKEMCSHEKGLWRREVIVSDEKLVICIVIWASQSFCGLLPKIHDRMIHQMARCTLLSSVSRKDGFCHYPWADSYFHPVMGRFSHLNMSQQKLQLCNPFEIPNRRYNLEFFNSGDYHECPPRNQFERFAYFCHSSFSEDLLQLLFFVWSSKKFKTDGI